MTEQGKNDREQLEYLKLCWNAVLQGNEKGGRM